MPHNAIDKPVKVNLGKAEVELKFDWNAVAALEEKTGKSMPDCLADLKAKPFSTSRLFVWAGIQHQMPVSIEEAGALMDFRQTRQIAEAIAAAVSAQFGNPGNEGDADPNLPATVTNGIPSGQSVATI